METLVWIGAAITLAGFAGILYTLFSLVRLKRAGLDDTALRDRMSRLLPVNLGVLLASVLGLMLVVLGLLLR